MSLEDTLTRRQIFDLRFANGQSTEAEQALIRMYASVNERLLRDGTEFRIDRLKQLRDDIAFILQNGFDELTQETLEMLQEFGEDEALFMFDAMSQDTNVVLSSPAPAQVSQAIFQRGMDAKLGPEQITINEALNQFSSKKTQEIKNAISDGILQGSTTTEVANNIQDLAEHRHKAQVRSLTRTMINHASSQARQSVAAQNSELLKGEEWVATLDSRTSLICAGRDGRIYPVGKGPQPPAHWNCRSLRVPVLKDEFNLSDSVGKRPEIGADGRGQTSANTKFDGWLRKQPASFQDEYFSQFSDGAEKAALFRRGGLSIQDFRDETGKNYTLEQLRALNPIAFEKANIG